MTSSLRGQGRGRRCRLRTGSVTFLARSLSLSISAGRRRVFQSSDGARVIYNDGGLDEGAVRRWANVIHLVVTNGMSVCGDKEGDGWYGNTLSLG